MLLIHRIIVVNVLAFLMLTAGLPASAGILTVPDEYPTVTTALAAASTGDTIQIGPGTYSSSSNGESYPLTVVTDGLHILGSGMGISILDAENTAGVLVLNASIGGRVSGVTITRGATAYGGGIRIDDGDWEIDHNLLLSNGAQQAGSSMVFYGDAAPWIHHNVVWASYDMDLEDPADPHTIQFRDTTTGIIEHNLVGRGDSNGIHFAPTSEPDVRLNILFENGINDGVHFGGRGVCAMNNTTPQISYNLFHDNVVSSILIRATGDFSADGANDLIQDDGIHDNIDGDPLLIDPDNHEFGIQADSPAIDAGDPALARDPDGTIADIGPFHFDQGSTAVGMGPLSSLRLHGAVPNPFNPRTEIRFELPKPSEVRVEVLDVRGRLIATLHDGPAPAGLNRVAWNGRDSLGSEVASGVYLAAVRQGASVRISPMLLLR